MKSRECLESYTYSAMAELNDLNCIRWVQDRSRLEERIISLEELLNDTMAELRMLK